MEKVTQQFKGASAMDILAWRRPIASGAILGAILAVWFTYVFFEYTTITFLSRIAAIVIGTGGVMAFTNNLESFRSDDVVSRGDKLYEKLRPYISNGLRVIFEIFAWTNINLSARVFLATFVTAFFGNYMSDAVFILFVVILAFSMPIVYEKKKPQIDAQIKKISDLFDKYLNIAKKKGSSVKEKAVEGKTDAEVALENMQKKNA